MVNNCRNQSDVENEGYLVTTKHKYWELTDALYIMVIKSNTVISI